MRAHTLNLLKHTHRFEAEAYKAAHTDRQTRQNTHRLEFKLFVQHVVSEKTTETNQRKKHRIHFLTNDQANCLRK